MTDRLANLRAELHDRLVHLGLDLLLQENFAALQDFLDVRPQLARLRIDDGKLLFDAERKGMVRGGHVYKNRQPRSARKFLMLLITILLLILPVNAALREGLGL